MEWITGFQKWLTEDESLHNAQLVANHCTAHGWSRKGISALCGNMRHESSINPDMYEYGYDWADDRGYGLVQWTPRSKYYDWATANGLPPEKGESQLLRIDYEMDNNIQWITTADYPLSFKEFSVNETDTLDYLTNAFCWNYERPNRTAGEESMPDRIAFAVRVYNEVLFDSTAPPPPSEPGAVAAQDGLFHLWLSNVLRW